MANYDITVPLPTVTVKGLTLEEVTIIRAALDHFTPSKVEDEGLDPKVVDNMWQLFSAIADDYRENH